MKNLILLLAAIFISITASAQLSGDSWKATKSKGSGEVTITYNYSGKFIYDNGNELDGLCIKIWDKFVEYVENTHNVDLKVNVHQPKDAVDFSEFYNSVQNGKGGVFGLADVTITQARKSEVQFSPSFFSNVSILLTNKAVPDLSDFNNIGSEFSGMTIIVQSGTTHEKRAKELKASSFPSLKIESVNSFKECYEMVNQNDNYFTYLDFSSYLSAIEDARNIKRHPAGDKTGEEFGFIMPKNSDWGPVMNEFFNRNGGFTNTTEYKKIVANSLGNHVVSMLDAINE
ncbi:ABC transporter substrate-binding protein [Marivirga salinae]|uniref:ABC transporter substrate-binding protein n=1 Tax=Marivirga salinarum TaxID=3059078 RepID=A0AA49JH73_9BACT|nr:ABC transporter substrate-binding protein [Marivirga sp. BDSF4-3]WKK78724.2 ABC transporter substrate-binding protein [Marivirga sp. BDSF4-3]